MVYIIYSTRYNGLYNILSEELILGGVCVEVIYSIRLTYGCYD